MTARFDIGRVESIEPDLGGAVLLRDDRRGVLDDDEPARLLEDHPVNRVTVDTHKKHLLTSVEQFRGVDSIPSYRAEPVG